MAHSKGTTMVYGYIWCAPSVFVKLGCLQDALNRAVGHPGCVAKASDIGSHITSRIEIPLPSLAICELGYKCSLMVMLSSKRGFEDLLEV